MSEVHAGLAIGGILTQTARRYPEKTALVFEQSRISYLSLESQANRFAHGLMSLGAQRGVKIALLSRNSAAWVIAHFAAAKSGATLVPVNFLFVEREIEYVLENAGASLLLVSAEFLPLANTLAARLPRLTHVICIDTADTNTANTNTHRTLDDLSAGQPSHPPESSVSENDDYTIMYTSGTTGRPKGVVSSHRSRAHVAFQGITDYRMHADLVCGMPLPLFHMGGLNTCFMTNMLAGATVVLLAKFDAAEMLAAIEREHVNFLFLAPSPLITLIEHPAFSRTDLSSLSWVMYGGAPMPAEVLRKVKENLPKVRLMQGYGSTECGQLTFLDPEGHRTHPESCGRPVALVEMRLADANGADVPEGEVGEIVVRGPNVMREYHGAPDATAEAFRGGWFHTGDLAKRDAQGFYTIVDRAKDMIISGSENIYPKEIEEVLYLHPAVQDAAVFGIPDEKWGEAVCAALVLRSGMQVSEAEIIEHCRAHLASYKKPKLVKFIASMPRTSIGKIAKSELREPYWRGRGRSI
jgi:acyl-CoA synthetase (AMP-forming)/AMP-acid ligase II